MSRHCFVTATPPTPNGDFHVGHLSGPYLAADVYTRYQRLRGAEVTAALSTDEYQTYVVTTAERLGRDPQEMAATSHRAMAQTLQEAGVCFDVVGRPDAQYVAYVRDFFIRLFDDGVFERRSASMGYDALQGRYLFESYASGRCPVCLAPTKGNICEECGSPNDATRLIPFQGQGDQETRQLTSWVLPLERYRSRLEAFYRDRLVDLRPNLRQLLRRLLDSELPDFPVSFPSDWGVTIGLPDTEGLVLNVWAEMYAGHLYWFSQAFGDESFSFEDAEYVQFFGFDNSYWYALVHPCLAFAAQDAGMEAALPSRMYTNEFYQYEHSKFSTSQQHLVWARDLVEAYGASPVRFYLCYSNPECQQTNFNEPDMKMLSRKHLIDPLHYVVQCCDEKLAGFRPDDQLSLPWKRVLEASCGRFAEAYAPESFSLICAAKALVQHLNLLVEHAEGLQATERQEATGMLTALASLQVLAAPILPQLAEELAGAFGVRNLRWADALRPPPERYSPIGRLASLSGGRALVPTPGLEAESPQQTGLSRSTLEEQA